MTLSLMALASWVSTNTAYTSSLKSSIVTKIGVQLTFYDGVLLDISEEFVGLAAAGSEVKILEGGCDGEPGAAVQGEEGIEHRVFQ